MVNSVKDLIVGWVLVVLSALAIIPGATLLWLQTDSLGGDSSQNLLSVTSGSGLLVAGSLLLGFGAMVLATGWRHRDLKA